MEQDVLDLCAHAVVPVFKDAAHALRRTATGVHRGWGHAGAALVLLPNRKPHLGRKGGALVSRTTKSFAEFARSHRLHRSSRDTSARSPARFESRLRPPLARDQGHLAISLAALGRSQLARFDFLQARRRELVIRYRTALAGVDGLRFVRTSFAAYGADHLVVVILFLTAVIADGSASASAQRESGGACTSDRCTRSTGTPASVDRPWGPARADELAPRVMSLPLHPSLCPTATSTGWRRRWSRRCAPDVVTGRPDGAVAASSTSARSCSRGDRGPGRLAGGGRSRDVDSTGRWRPGVREAATRRGRRPRVDPVEAPDHVGERTEARPEETPSPLAPAMPASLASAADFASTGSTRPRSSFPCRRRADGPFGPRPRGARVRRRERPTLALHPPGRAGDRRSNAGHRRRLGGEQLSRLGTGSYAASILPKKLAIDEWYVRAANPLVDALVVLGLVSAMCFDAG